VSSRGSAWQNDGVGVKKKHSPKRSKKKKQKTQVAALKTSPVNRDKDDVFGFMKGRLKIAGDIESPMEGWEYWDPAKNLEK
jgi:hypothetical protein